MSCIIALVAKKPRYRKRPIDREKLRHFIYRKNLKYADLADLIRMKFPDKPVSLSAIEKIMCGQNSGARVAERIAVALNKPKDFFLEAA